MNFETLKKDNKRKYIVGSIVIIAILATITYISTRAKYRVTSSTQLASGVINYSPSDLEIVAIKIQNDSNEYDNSDTVPITGYELNSELSVCKVGETKQDVTITYENGKINISNLSKKGTKCEIYFNKIKTKDQILANKIIGTRTDFSTVFKENTTGKIYTAKDDDGISYYFAGAVDNNWVKFGGFYWRIIRINGDDTIRVIYNGPTTDQTGEITIGTSKWSHKDGTGSPDYAYSNDNAYAGYMYGIVGSETYDATHTNTNSSYVKQVVDEWYNANLNKEGIKEHIDTNAGFCGDRSLANGTGIGTTQTYYGSYNRLSINKMPTLKCPNSNDLYTVSSSNKGNQALTYPVGLISADEVVYAGGSTGYSWNTSYYLYINASYWTMSPDYFTSSGIMEMFYVFPGGGLIDAVVGNEYYIRPVINLKANTPFKAGTNGTKTNPYELIN